MINWNPQDVQYTKNWHQVKKSQNVFWSENDQNRFVNKQAQEHDWKMIAIWDQNLMGL